MVDYSDHPLIQDTRRRYLTDPDNKEWREIFAQEYVKYDPPSRMLIRDRIEAELEGGISSGPARKLSQLWVFRRHLDHLEAALRMAGR
jgi:hypothetical protein